MQYWLLKSEPNTWSWDQQVKEGPSMWDGVRNYQARNNLKKMKKGDLCFFYHSVIEKNIVGIVEVVKEYFGYSTIKAKQALEILTEEQLEHIRFKLRKGGLKK